MKKKRGLADSLECVRSRPHFLVFTVLYDFLFIILFGVILKLYTDYSINMLYSAGSSMLGSRVMDTSFFGRMVLAFIIFIIVLYLVYSIFQSLSWRYIMLIAGDKTDIWNHLKGFFLINIPVFIIFAVLSVMSFLIEFYDRGSIYVTILFYIVIAALIYFAYTAYSIMDKKESGVLWPPFVRCINEISYLGPRFLAALLVVGIANYLVGLFGIVHPSIVILLGVVLVLPLSACARVYFYIAAKQ